MEFIKATFWKEFSKVHPKSASSNPPKDMVTLDLKKTYEINRIPTMREKDIRQVERQTDKENSAEVSI
jgi:hypothetical protein